MQIKYSYYEHLIVQQTKAEEAMLAEFEQGDYTLENPLVKYNAYLINPLSAVILFRTDEDTIVTLTVFGKTKEAAIQHTFPKTKIHMLPVLGLYSNYENKVELRTCWGGVSTVTIKTPDVYDGKDLLLSMKTTPEYLQDNIIFLTPAGASYASGFDYAGDPRWHLNVPCIFDMKRLKNGNILIGSDRLIQSPYYMSGLYEMSLVGKIYKEYRLPGGYHHDQFEMPDGNLLSLTQDLRSETVEDMCVMLDRETGEIIKTWEYREFLNPGIGKSGSWSEEDWFHNNAVWFDEKTNTLTFSGRHMDCMPNVDFDTGKLNFIIGDPEGWPQDWVDKYFFKAAGNGEFDWQYEQHACVITPDGDVMCFDNGHWRSKVRENYITSKDNYSRGVRYRINTKEMTIEQVWQYGKERGFEFYSPYICNVEYYNERHYLVHSGGIAYKDKEPSEQIGGLLTDGEDGVELRSITTEVYEDKVLLELQVRGNFYRAEKLKFYTEGNNLKFGEGKILGAMGVTKEFDTDIPMESSGEQMPESCNACIQEEEDRFIFRSRFEKGQMVMLLLEGETTHRYYISTTAVPHLAMCVGTFFDSDERNTTTNINKAGLKGSFDVRVIIDDKKYETGVTIQCEP